ncbi:MAG: rod shape-determining protein RodA [Bacteroidetes bacterium]|nr:rod shape-determining protein RodA [Bacteroidota bacterium]
MATSLRSELKLDWITVGIYVVFVLFGWLNIYAASGATQEGFWADLVNFDKPQGKQFLFIVLCGILCFVTLTVDLKLVQFVAWGAYGLALVLCILVLFVGKDINGARAWFSVGGVGIQPSEFAKLGTCLVLAKFMSRHNFSLSSGRDRLGLLAIILVPVIIVLLQKDTGTALVFGSFVFMFLREGMSVAIFLLLMALVALAVMVIAGLSIYVVVSIILGLTLIYYLRKSIARFLARIGLYLNIRGKNTLGPLLISGLLCVWSLSVNLVIAQLKPHQQQRIQALFNPEIDPTGVNWNTTQSKIAIGSGGFWGKGFMNGTQTKYNFVPQQHTDFIFCTPGEEFGWVGTTLILVLFFVLLYQLTYLAESSKSRFARIFGYSVVSILFFHVLVNVAMTIGLAPVIGIPLPFFSYGGSSLISFTIMVFLMLNFYANRVNILAPDSY